MNSGCNIIVSLLAAVSAFISPPAFGQSFSEIVAFGDSWSDGGNANQVTNGAVLPLLRAPYANGRFTNGYVWVDYLADRLGVARAVASHVDSSGTNFSFGGALLDDATHQDSLWTVEDIGYQVNSYMSNHTPIGQELFTFFGGGNDIAGGDLNLSDELNRLKGYISSVHAAGGRHFLVANMPDFAKIADYIGDSTKTSVVNSYNNMLDNELSSLRLLYPDADFYEADFHGVLDRVYADPSAYGFKDLLKNNSFSGDYLWTDSFFGDHRDNISNYMWIDGIHPTDNLHELFAIAAFNAVPEPAMPIPMGIALVAIISRRGRKSV